MSNRSRLHIPRPSARPGDKPDFSYLATSPAGAVQRPNVDARTREIEYLASDMVRVLDDDHEAKGPWNQQDDLPKVMGDMKAKAPRRQRHGVSRGD
ncbi:MAG: hypothetical protein AAGD86_02780 [Pseudomonadota bacterium]